MTTTPTPITVAKPPSLQQWLERLDNLRQLPLLPDTPTAVLTAINRPNSTAETVAQVIRRDPVLCMHLFDSANRIVSKTGNEIKHLPHLISLLGLPNVAQQVRAAPALKPDSHNPGYIEALTQSQLCAEITAQLWPLKGLAANEGFFPALLLMTPLWALWHSAPDLMQQRQGLLANPALSSAEVDNLTLGLPLQELSNALIQHWALPHQCHSVWHFDAPLTRKALAAIHHQQLPRFIQQHPQQETALQSVDWLLLCCQLAASQGCRNWFSRRSRRSQSALATLLHQPQDKVDHLIHQAAHRCAWLSPQQLHPAARLLMAWDETQQQACYCLQPEAAEQPSTPATTDTETPTPSHNNNLVLLKANLERLSERGGSFANLNQLLGVLVNTLNEGVGLEQVMLLTLNRNRDKLQSHFSTGIDVDSPLRSLRIALTPNTQKGIMGKLLKQQSGLLVNQENRQAALKALPPELVPHLPNSDFALMSLFHRDNPIGLTLVASPNFNQTDYRHLKRCCQAASKAIQDFALQQSRSRKSA
ncbi:hypothetical protein R50073_44250 [Maricurvus nonylphenolicus]|uniref:HDOD domain-containing protein n=1 Tax=Maricurvus nonylphenolicus TaxID=1008307 RepID=UPI0036F31871